MEQGLEIIFSFSRGEFMNYTTTDGVTLYYEKDGSGTPCVFLHGGPGYWSKSFQHFTSERLGKALEMIYLDQRGCGRSALANNGNYSLGRLLLDLEEIRVHLHIDKWYLIGHSFGGLLALTYAQKHPDHVKGLILSNATLNMRETFAAQIKKGRELLGVEKTDIAWVNVSELIDLFNDVAQPLIEQNLFYKLQYQSLVDVEKMDSIDADFSSNGDFQNYIFSSEEYFQDFRELTSFISVPVLVLSGKYDFAIGPEHQEGFQFKQAVFKQFATGHHPYAEVPEEFTKAILDFITQKK